MGQVIGLTLAKINGIFEFDVLNARWQDQRALTQHATGGGMRNATGLEAGSGSFEEVISKSGSTDWRSLEQFRIDIYDKETRSIIVASFSRADWDNLGGNADNASASSKKTIDWKAEQVNKA